MNALVIVPDATAWLVAMCVVFGGGGLLVMGVGALRILAEERRVKRAAEASRGVQFDSTTYPGRTIR